MEKKNVSNISAVCVGVAFVVTFKGNRPAYTSISDYVDMVYIYV